MKNIFKALVLVVFGMVLIISCDKSKPEPEPVVVEDPVEEEVVVDEAVTEEEVTEEEVISDVTYQEYTVVEGDTLSQIAERFYGSKDKAYFFPIIMGYNMDVVSILDPDTIEPGMVLRIPDFDEFMASPEHVLAAKAEFEKDAMLYEKKGLPGVAKLLRERADRM